MELENILFKFPAAIVPPAVSGEILGLEDNHPPTEYPIFFFQFFHQRPIISVSLDGLVEFEDLLLLVLDLNRVMLDVALTLIQLKLQLGAFPLGLFLLKIVLFLQLNDLPAQRLHLQPQLLYRVQHQHFILTHLLPTPALHLNCLKLCHQVSVQ